MSKLKQNFKLFKSTYSRTEVFSKKLQKFFNLCLNCLKDAI